MAKCRSRQKSPTVLSGQNVHVNQMSVQKDRMIINQAVYKIKGCEYLGKRDQ